MTLIENIFLLILKHFHEFVYRTKLVQEKKTVAHLKNFIFRLFMSLLFSNAGGDDKQDGKSPESKIMI